MATDLENRPETDAGSDASNPGQQHYDNVFSDLTSKEHMAKDGESGSDADGSRGKSGGLYNSGGGSSGGSASQGQSDAPGGARGLYNRGKDSQSRLRNRARKFKKKWIVAAAFGGGGLGVLVLLLLLLVGTFKIPHLAENITAYQFARVTQQMSRNTTRIVSEKISISSANKAIYDKLEQRYATIGKVKEAWSKLDKFRPNKVISNMQGSGQAALEYSPDKYGRQVLRGIQLTDRSIAVSNINTAQKLIPGFKLAKDIKFSTEVAPRFNTALKANAWGPIIRGRVAKQIRKELGVSLIAWKVGEYKGKTSEQARLQVEREANKRISGDSKESIKTQPLKDATEKAVDAEEKAIADDGQLKDTIKNGGNIKAVRDSITDSFKQSPYLTTLSFINGAYALAVPVCIVYEGSVDRAGPTIDQQMASQQKAYYLVASAADQQKDGTDGAAEATGAYNEKLGDINGSIPMLRASGAPVDTSGYTSAEAGASGGTFSIADAVFGSSGVTSVINTVADKLCPKLTDPKLATAVGAANILAVIFSGGTAGAAEGAAQKAATSVVTRVATRIAETVLTRKGLINASAKVKDIVKSGVKSGAKIAATTILAKLIVMSKSGYTNNGLEQGGDFANMADSGGNIAGNELDRKQFYGRPLTKDEAAVSAGQTMAFVNEQNASKSAFQRYFALSNPQSLLTRFATSSASAASNLHAPSLLKQLGNLLDPTMLFSSLFTRLNPQTVHASAAQDAAMLNYGNVQFGFSVKEQSVMDTDATYGLLENQRLLEQSGNEDEINSEYGKCFTKSLGDLISNRDIVLDENNNVKDSEGTCAPKKLTLGNSKYGKDMVFRWRVAHSYDSTLDQLDDMQNITENSSAADFGGGSSFRIATFNVLGAVHPSPLSYKTRADRAINTITSKQLDVVGFQEFEVVQRAYIYPKIKGTYDIFPSASQKNNDHNVENSIIWNHDKFEMTGSGFQPGLKYFCGSHLNAPYVKLRDKATTQEFYVLNTHDPANSDHCPDQSPKIRYDNALQHLQFMQQLESEGLPVFYTGDFNSKYAYVPTGNGSPWDGGDGKSKSDSKNLTYCILAANGPYNDAYDAFKKRKVTCPTQTPPGAGGGIDHVYVSKGVEVTAYDVVSGGKKGAGPNGADHPTMIFDVTIPGSSSGGGTDFIITTYNLPSKRGWGPSDWAKGVNLIKTKKMDVIGFQEFKGGNSNFNYMKEHLSNYDSFPAIASAGIYCASTQPIFYNTDKFSFLKGEYLTYPRYNNNNTDCREGHLDRGFSNAPIAWLSDKRTGQTIIVMNTHNAANGFGGLSGGEGQVNRYKAAKIYINKIQQLKSANPGVPIFFTGDFNEGTGVRRSRNITYGGIQANLFFCMVTSKGLMRTTLQPPKDCNQKNGEGGVDYIYVTKDVQVDWHRYETGRAVSGSDHPKTPHYAHVIVKGSGSKDAPATKVTKVLTIIEENHSLAQMKSNMPYAFSLANKYAYASNYTAIRHPSLPNYISIAGGSTMGVTDDKLPGVNSLKGQSIFGQALSKGKTAKLYAESMVGTCVANSDSGRYQTKHNPWAYFVDERSACRQYDVPATRFASDVAAGKLPNIGMLIPNMCNDAHDCSLATADNWLKDIMPKIFAGEDWKSGRLAVIITADEDDRRSDNKVLTVVIHPGLDSTIVSSPLNHYSLSKFYSEVTGSAALRNARGANSLSKAFGLSL